MVAAEDLQPFSTKSLKDRVELVSLAVEDSAQYIQSSSELNFFKLNRYIEKGEPLKRSDLSAKNLVRTGKLTQVIVEQDGLKVKLDAIARQTGKYGDFVNLYNPESKKQIRGEVIDYNKVRVEI